MPMVNGINLTLHIISYRTKNEPVLAIYVGTSKSGKKSSILYKVGTTHTIDICAVAFVDVKPQRNVNDYGREICK